MYLYLDTTLGITLGLLNDDFEWISYKESSEKAVSKVIHSMIHELLTSENTTLENIEGVFLSSGPGSYTGMRISDGIAKIFEWHKIKIYSFYHFKVPKCLKVNSGVWKAKAFKGEDFIYSWSGDDESKALVKADTFTDSNKTIYTHSDTKKMIQENGKSFFKKLLSENQFLDLFYYRSLEEEFKRS